MKEKIDQAASSSAVDSAEIIEENPDPESQATAIMILRSYGGAAIESTQRTQGQITPQVTASQHTDFVRL